MGVFKCIHTGEKYVLNADMSIECMTPEHNAWMVVGVLQMIVYGLGIPIGIAYLLRRANRRKDIDGGLDNEKTKAALGFVYEGYSKNCYAWECLIMLRKAVLAIVIISCEDSPFYQTFFSAMLLQVYTYVHLQFRPYREKKETEHDDMGSIFIETGQDEQKSLQVLETTSLCITTLTLSGAMMFFTHPPPKISTVRQFLRRGSLSVWAHVVPLVVSIVLFVLNVCLILRFAAAFARSFQEHRRTIMKEIARSTSSFKRIFTFASPGQHRHWMSSALFRSKTEDDYAVEIVPADESMPRLSSGALHRGCVLQSVTSNPMYVRETSSGSRESGDWGDPMTQSNPR